jgi:hypothetical protein
MSLRLQLSRKAQNAAEHWPGGTDRCGAGSGSLPPAMQWGAIGNFVEPRYQSSVAAGTVEIAQTLAQVFGDDQSAAP